MADLSITASAVLPGADATLENGTAGATITAGQRVYLDTATGRYELADADAATTLERRTRGIALNGASDGQPLRILRAGDLTMNAVLTAGVTYYGSPTPGGIAPRADVLTGDHVEIIGVAKSTTVLAVALQYPDVASA
jgi:hypothetical protein